MIVIAVRVSADMAIISLIRGKVVLFEGLSAPLLPFLLPLSETPGSADVSSRNCNCFCPWWSQRFLSIPLLRNLNAMDHFSWLSFARQLDVRSTLEDLFVPHLTA